MAALTAAGLGVVGADDARGAATPVGDDVASVQIAAAAKLVSLACTDRIGRKGLLPAAERRLLLLVREADASHLNALVVLLGDDAPTTADFAFAFPAAALGSPDGALQLLGTVERLVIGTLLGGVAATVDPGTRALLGGIAVADGTHLTSLLAAQGRPTVEARLPLPLTLERASERLGRYLRTPGFDQLTHA